MSKRIFLLFFSVLVFVSGIFAFIVNKDLYDLPIQGQLPMYAKMNQFYKSTTQYWKRFLLKLEFDLFKTSTKR